MLINENETIQVINEQLQLISRRDGLTFGTDAYMLSAFVRSNAGTTVADLGSGTGVIPLLLKARQKCERAYAIEIQSEFADLIVRNCTINGMDDSIIPVLKDIRHLTLKDVGGRYVDYVVSNPPYMKADSGKGNSSSAKNIARHEICGDIGDFCVAASKIVKSGGLVYMVYRPDRLTDLLAALRLNRLEPKRMVMVAADHESEPSMVLVEAQKDAGVGLRILPTVYQYEDGSKKSIQTSMYQQIYLTCHIPDVLLDRGR